MEKVIYSNCIVVGDNIKEDILRHLPHCDTLTTIQLEWIIFFILSVVILGKTNLLMFSLKQKTWKIHLVE